MRKKAIVIIPILMITIAIIILTIFGIHKNFKIGTTKQVSAPIQELEDTESPIITLKGDKNINIKEGEVYKEQGYSAKDNLEGSIVKKVVVSKQIVNEENYKMVYTVSDKAGNTVQEFRDIHLEKNNDKAVIYLTFDDGPTTSSTSQILDILKKYNVKATFFILNYSSNTEPLVKREIEEGHSVGIHGYSHNYKDIYKSEDAYMENLNKLQTKIYNSTGVKTTITRFPGGSSNTISKFNPKIMTRLSKLVVEKGYTYYDWNVDSNDAGGAKNSNEVYHNVVNQLYKDGRNFVLMHDFSGNEKTIGALEKIIQYGKKNGYTFKTITKDTKMMKHPINN